jgi:NDP-sugar pyrophosphorylase family protein
VPHDLAAVVLAAGAGTRLRPLTWLRPKALVPVANVALVDAAVSHARRCTDSIAVNVHHGRAALESHLARSVHISIEREQALGTAGALGLLRPWIDGRPTLVINADAWLPPGLDLTPLVAGPPDRLRLLVVPDRDRADFDGRWRYAGVALMPWDAVRDLEPEPSGLYERVWRAAREAGSLDLVPHEGAFFDCGTLGEYLAANLAASGGDSVVGPGAMVEGSLESSVVWPGAVVRRGERLQHAIRATERITVLVRRPRR